MIRAALRTLAIPVILTAVTACDNVTWGGIDLRLQPPPSEEDTAAADTLSREPSAPPPLELGPVLYTVRRGNGTGTLLPVAEITDQGLRALPLEGIPDFGERFRTERLAPGTRFALFAAGSRVGTFHATGAAPADTTLCAPRPRAEGRVQIVPGAVDASPLLAVDGSAALTRPPEAFRPRTHNRDQRVTSLNLAAAIFNRLEAPWPADLVDSRADIRVFQPGGLPADSPAIAATFLFRDQLETGPAPATAWSIFLVAEPGPDGYADEFVWYRTAGPEGKGVPRYLEHADWNDDGRADLLLEVLGRSSRWFAALERRPTGWTRTYQDPCGEADVQRASPSAGL